MRKHNGMRPQDIVVLLKIISIGTCDWYIRDMSFSLGISLSEISESLNRSLVAGFLTRDKKEVFRNSLLEFLEYGLKYVFPHTAGPGASGMPTAHSAYPLNSHFKPHRRYIWKDLESNYRGQVIVPLHPGVPEACRKDENLYELLSLIDGLRVGIKEERITIMQELCKRI